VRKSIYWTMLFVSALALLVGAAACAPAPAPTPVPPTSVPPTPIPPPPTAMPAPAAAPTAVPPAAAKAKPVSAGTAVAGADLFRLACAACHGADRGGSKFTRKGQTIEVPDLQWDGLQKMYSTKPDRGTVQQQLALAITKGQDEEGGSFSETMPRWSNLSSDQVDSLIQYLQTAGSATAPTTLSDAATQLMGQDLFDLSCAACHGKNAQGGNLTVDDQTIAVPALQWADLAKTYSTDATRGTVEQQLVLAITKGQDESGDQLNDMMPRWTVLSQDQVSSLVDYLKTVK
jgi:mono/diheme cytochrome c family protein